MKNLWIIGLLAALSVSGCKSAYYGAMEKVGIDKREIMVDRVLGARKAQDEAKETIKTTLEQFSAVVEIKSGDRKSIV